MGVLYEVPVMPLGQTVCTDGVARWGVGDASPDNPDLTEDDVRMSLLRAAWVSACIHRHEHGDWGDLKHEEDVAANDWALIEGSRVFSVYQVPDELAAGVPEAASGDRVVWIITEADRSLTCVMFPDEY